MGAMNYSKVAELYDYYATATFDVSFFLQEAAATLGAVLELMSGTGRVSVPLAKAGIRRTCVDASPEMLAILKRKMDNQGLVAKLVEMDVTKLALGRRFDLVLIPFHSFSELQSRNDQIATLKAIHSHLTEHGRFICTLHNPALRVASEDGRLRLVSEAELNDGRTLLLWSVARFNPVEGVVEGKQIYEFYSNGDLVSKSMLNIRFAVITQTDFEQMAQEAGFRVRAMYGNYDRTPFQSETSPYMIWELSR